MATLYVTEYQGVRRTDGNAQAPFNFKANQSVAIGGSSTQSAAFNAGTYLIRVHADAICSIAIGASPTAAATGHRMSADQTEYYTVDPGQKIAVITNT
jgi:hypothetical protein